MNKDNFIGVGFAVFRSGVRVSETIYTDSSPEGQAKEEIQMWKRSISKYPDGSIIELKPVNVR